MDIVRYGREALGGGRVTVAAVVVGIFTNGAGPAGIRVDDRAGDLHATIRTTSYGVPHILAADYAGLGFGLGYAFTKDNICEIADRWVTVNGERSRYFGADTKVPFGHVPFTARPSNLSSDFFWKRVLDQDLVGRQLLLAPPLGPTLEVRELVRGYAAGYNRYLSDTGVDRLSDPRCRGAAWVRPITEKDVYLRALHWNMYLSSGELLDQYAAAAPRDKTNRSRPAPAERPQGDFGGPGSNMIALGKDATDNGRGMLFANPHWFWEGPERWYEAQLTIPGKLDVAGAAVLGTPVILFGHTKGVAWSHTLSTPQRYTVYQLKLADPAGTSYRFDGEVRKIEPRVVSVDVRRPDGTLEKRQHTFWETHFGPMIEETRFPWTATAGYAVRDVALTFRWLNQELAMNQAQSVEEIDRAGRTYMAIGWLNTIAADANGTVYYADRTATPHVTDQKLASCVSSAAGKRILATTKVAVMDGWRSACEWGTDPDAVAAGTFGPGTLPKLIRADYATNSNDSYWVNNLRQPLEGYPRILGEERTPRSLRTRVGLLKIERRLAGTDGEPGNRFSLDQLERITMNNRVLAGELWRDSVVSVCRRIPARAGSAGACAVLAAWDLSENLDSKGAVLWRRFYERLSPDWVPGNSLFAKAFDPADPMNTPSGLNTGNPRVIAALGEAIQDLEQSAIPLDAPLRAYQYVEKAGVRFAVPGGPPQPGQYNLVVGANGWVPGKGWPDINVGSSFIMWVQFTDAGPVGRSVTAYGQSNDPTSPHLKDQTILFGEGKSKKMLFTDAEIRSDPGLVLTELCGREDGSRLPGGCGERPNR